jgi:hypothetical protein
VLGGIVLTNGNNSRAEVYETETIYYTGNLSGHTYEIEVRNEYSRTERLLSSNGQPSSILEQNIESFDESAIVMTLDDIKSCLFELQLRNSSGYIVFFDEFLYRFFC